MKDILVALDASARAPEVLAAAVHLARRMGARLHVFRAVGVPPEVPREALAMRPEELPAFLERRAEAELRELAKGVPAELVASVGVALGTPWEAICEAGKRCGAGMVVIGSHGYGGLDRVLGTTAAKVVNHADRSVVVVRAGQLLDG